MISSERGAAPCKALTCVAERLSVDTSWELLPLSAGAGGAGEDSGAGAELGAAGGDGAATGAAAAGAAV